jgi:hypothetical protein
VSAAAAASSATRIRGINGTTSQPNGEVLWLRQCSGMSPEASESSSGRTNGRLSRDMARQRFLVTGSAKRFRTPALADLARELERKHGEQFQTFGATLRVRPARFYGFSNVWEGLSLDLDPDDVKSWNWWGDFEADLPVRVHRRFSRTWSDVVPLQEVEVWAVAELDAYAERLASAEG